MKNTQKGNLYVAAPAQRGDRYGSFLASTARAIMMGQHSRSEALFYYFRLEDQVPENHQLRLIEKHIRFAFVREKAEGQLQGDGPALDRPRAFRGASR